MLQPFELQYFRLKENDSLNLIQFEGALLQLKRADALNEEIIQKYNITEKKCFDFQKENLSLVGRYNNLKFNMKTLQEHLFKIEHGYFLNYYLLKSYLIIFLLTLENDSYKLEQEKLKAKVSVPNFFLFLNSKINL